jgi:hypothetical protein
MLSCLPCVPTDNQTRIMRPYIAERPRYHYDPVLATWQDFTLPEVDGSGYVTVTGAATRCTHAAPA